MSTNVLAIEGGNVSVEQFQSWWHSQVDDEFNSAVVFPFPGGDGTRRMSHALLDGLAKRDAYRTRLKDWLKEAHADTAEELLAQWKIRYHRAFIDSFDLFPHQETLDLLWTLKPPNPIYAINRDDCRSRSPEQIAQAIDSASARILAEKGDLIVSDVTEAVDREFQRETSPRPGDRPVPAVMAALAMSSFRAMVAGMPKEDGDRVYRSFSYNPNVAKPSPEEACETAWVVSHTVLEWAEEDPGKHVSARLMRRSMTSSGYATIFSSADVPNAIGRSKPAIPEFTPGKAFIYYPELIWKNRASGTARFEIEVDEKGEATNTTVLSSAIIPEQVTSVDGSTLASSELMRRVVDAYVKSGTFVVKSTDGHPARYSVPFSVKWAVN
jgi:hypothetical protein